jgi:hypothetical protein
MATLPWNAVTRTTQQGFTLDVPIQFGTTEEPTSLVGRTFEAIVSWPGDSETFALGSSSLYVSGAAADGLLMFKLSDDFTRALPALVDGQITYEIAETTGGIRAPVIAGRINVAPGLTAT